MRVGASRLFTVVLASVLVMLVVALVRDRGHHDQDRSTDATALLVTSRSGLQVCVESLGSGVRPSAIRERVRAGLDRVGRHPDFVDAGLDRRPVDVSEGCSAVPSIDRPDYRSSNRLGAPAAVERASPYRLMVFVTPPERLVTAFDGQDPALTAQEVLCHNGVCPVVTTGAYLSPTSLADDAMLDRALTEGIGLRP